MKTAVVAALAILSVPAFAFAQETSGSLVPTDGGAPLEIESQEVRVRINNGLAVTTVGQVFKNNRAVPLEAVYSFPVPNEASVSNFSMWINGKEVIGEVLEKKQARQIYQSITARREDPGLLEQVAYNLFEMRVFPVPANGTQRVQIAYYQPVEIDSGSGTYVYPLEAKTRLNSRVTGSFKVDVEILSEIPLKRVHSPSHRDALAVAESASGLWRASVETPRGALDRDFVLVYDLSREKTGLGLVPYKGGKEDGYFMMLLTAGEELDRVGVPTNYTFVLDVSGSMGDQNKLQHAVRLVEEILKGLGEGDRFNIVTFNIAAESFRKEPVAADAEARRAAVEFLRARAPRGGTDLVPALDAAAGQLMADRPNVLILLSDGNATQSDDHSRFQRLLERNGPKTRIFSIGVGNDVNRPLMNALAQATGGYCDVVSTQDEVERKAALLKTKILHQVAEGLALKIDGVEVYDVVPATLPNLFRGAQLAVYGRVRGSGEGRIEVRGTIGGKERVLVEEFDFPREERDNPEVRRMWAWRRADALMQENRARGEDPSRVKEIVALGTKYSIVTPHTSFLVLENDEQYRRFGIEQRNARQIQEDRAAQERRASRTVASRPSSGGGSTSHGGGSIELGALGLLATLAGGRAIVRRRKK